MHTSCVALVHEFFNRCPGRGRNQTSKQPAGANKYQDTPHPLPPVTPANTPFVADKAKSVQADALRTLKAEHGK
jgi:hypothetical protein